MSTLGGGPDRPTLGLEADLDRLVQRLRGLSSSAWRSRRSVVTDLLNGMERMAARLEGRPPRTVLSVPDHALADAVAVVGGDAVAAAGRTGDASIPEEIVLDIRRVLDSTC